MQKEKIIRAKPRQNLTYCECLLYILYYFPLEGRGCRLRKSPLFFGKIFLLHLKALHYIILHVARYA